MSANVAITDTFDQWRTKSNEFIVMTQSAGSDDFIKLNNTTNSTSNTTGSIISAGGQMYLLFLRWLTFIIIPCC